MKMGLFPLSGSVFFLVSIHFPTPTGVYAVSCSRVQVNNMEGICRYSLVDDQMLSDDETVRRGRVSTAWDASRLAYRRSVPLPSRERSIQNN